MTSLFRNQPRSPLIWDFPSPPRAGLAQRPRSGSVCDGIWAVQALPGARRPAQTVPGAEHPLPLCQEQPVSPGWNLSRRAAHRRWHPQHEVLLARQKTDQKPCKPRHPAFLGAPAPKPPVVIPHLLTRRPPRGAASEGC